LIAGVKRFHISSSVKSTAGATNTKPATEAGPACRRARKARDHEQSEPAPHRRPDQNLRIAAARVEHGERVGEPAADRTVAEVAARFPVAGIVEADAGAPGLFGPMRQRRGLGTFHVGLVAGQPEQARGGAGTVAHGDGAALGPRSNFQEFQAVIIH
jgi:hypothetical protein